MNRNKKLIQLKIRRKNVNYMGIINEKRYVIAETQEDAISEYYNRVGGELIIKVESKVLALEKDMIEVEYN